MYFRRLKIFLALVGLIVAGEMGRLVWLQVVRHEDYLAQAERSLIRPRQFTPPLRGAITDRFGKVLARDISTFGIAVDYRALAENPLYLKRQARKDRQGGVYPADLPVDQIVEQIKAANRLFLADLAGRCGVTENGLEEIRRRILDQVAGIKETVSRAQGRPMVVAEELTSHTLLADVPEPVFYTTKLPAGFSRASAPKRDYPASPYASHLIGFLGPALTAEDKARDWRDPFENDPLRAYRPGERRGIRGIEQACEATLRGRRGERQFDRNDTEILNRPPVDGRNVALALDLDLQKDIYHVLAAHVQASYQANMKDWGLPAAAFGQDSPCGGAAVVINIGRRTVNGVRVEDGEVLALVSYPSYDGNSWRRQFDQLKDDPRAPLLFRTVSGLYPPGSIVKPAVLAAALTESTVKPETALLCRGYLISPTFKAFHCWNPYGHGELQPAEAIAHSCNVFFFQVGEQMGLPMLASWFGRFGFGRSQTPLIEDNPGIVPEPAGILRRRGTAFVPADARNAAIGQGDLAVTPLAAANMMAALARDGLFVYPVLVRDPPGQRPPIDLGIRPEHLRIVHKGLDDVVNAPHGTAWRYARMTTTRLAGKTGSAQCPIRFIQRPANPPRFDGQGREILDKLRFPPEFKTVQNAEGQTELKRVGSAHAWFAGYAPADRPTVAIACLIEYGMSGGHAAGPLARDLIQVCINHDYVPAPTESKQNVAAAMDAGAADPREARP